MLIGAGAQVDARDQMGNTPLMTAVQKNWNKDNIAALLGAG
jgi:ankyrin repeat protein